MAWYWQVSVCWECRQCGSIDYGSRFWFWKSPPGACDHCGNTTFTGIDSYNRPLSWSLPAPTDRIEAYLRVFGWFFMLLGMFGAGHVVLFYANLAGVSAPPYHVVPPGTMSIGFVLWYLIQSRPVLGWIFGSVASVIGTGVGIGLLIENPTWWSGIMTAWWFVGLIVAWKSATVLRRRTVA